MNHVFVAIFFLFVSALNIRSETNQSLVEFVLVLSCVYLFVYIYYFYFINNTYDLFYHTFPISIDAKFINSYFCHHQYKSTRQELIYLILFFFRCILSANCFCLFVVTRKIDKTYACFLAYYIVKRP